MEEMLIFIFLTAYNSRIVCKLKPVNWIKTFVAVNQKPILTIFRGFNVLYECVKTKIEKERTKTVTLKYSLSDRDVRGLEIGSSN